jgi:hypothetical protein
MKTRIIIEIESDFHPIYQKDVNGEIDEDEPVTTELEKSFHEIIDLIIRSYVEDNLESEFFDYEQPDYSVEDYDCFSDYGKLNIKITTEELNQEVQER